MLKRFDFRCTKCNHVEEQWVDSEDKLTTCYECGHTAVRVISPVSTQYRGTGWPDADDRWAKDHEKAARK